MGFQRIQKSGENRHSSFCKGFEHGAEAHTSQFPLLPILQELNALRARSIALRSQVVEPGGQKHVCEKRRGDTRNITRVSSTVAQNGCHLELAHEEATVQRCTGVKAAENIRVGLNGSYRRSAIARAKLGHRQN